jgi:hypothetical protein
MQKGPYRPELVSCLGPNRRPRLTPLRVPHVRRTISSLTNWDSNFDPQTYPQMRGGFWRT